MSTFCGVENNNKVVYQTLTPINYFKILVKLDIFV
ncbi:unnamed protein product [Brassica oleracea]|uniref:(rape) hypothetical protein n=1 Tax=Brassica napus TaxID=3708 RepID=A0A816Q1L6_BRANA|nr:unnamed protein product [Brassica napus]